MKKHSHNNASLGVVTRNKGLEKGGEIKVNTTEFQIMSLLPFVETLPLSLSQENFQLNHMFLGKLIIVLEICYSLIRSPCG